MTDDAALAEAAAANRDAAGGAATECDVLVIGGGPAGSTAAALLAEGGRDVVLLEKGEHPRFHIGESLLPRNLAILDRLGLRAEVHAMGVYKPGAEFVDDATGRSAAFPFAFALNKAYTHSYQVRRSEFDAMLFRHAREKGARALEQVRVTGVDLPSAPGARARVTATGPDGAARQFAPRFVLDASGRDTFMAGRLGLKVADKRNATAAVFAHYRNVERRGGELDGYISVHLVRDGWFWMIPLPDDVMSVGFVGTQSAFKGRAGSVAGLFLEKLRDCPTVAARMAGAERISEITTTGNYSYRARASWGEGYMMIGDAFAFVDPVFSSGVLLAMTAGEIGADVAAAWLRSPERGRAAARAGERALTRAMDSLNWLIYRINDPVLRALFLAPHNRFGMRDGLVSMLAGNLRNSGRALVAILAFKSIYRVMALLHRRGWMPEIGGQAVAPAE